jgi:hypothetical protein
LEKNNCSWDFLPREIPRRPPGDPKHQIEKSTINIVLLIFVAIHIAKNNVIIILVALCGYPNCTKAQ